MYNLCIKITPPSLLHKCLKHVVAKFVVSCIVVRYLTIHMSKRTYQPSKQKRATTHGFLVRSATTAGQNILRSRRRKGRAQLTVKNTQ